MQSNTNYITRDKAVAQLKDVLRTLLGLGLAYGVTPGGSAATYLQGRLQDFNGNLEKMLQREAEDTLKHTLNGLGREMRLDLGGLKCYFTIDENKEGLVHVRWISVGGDQDRYYPQFIAKANEYLAQAGYRK